MYHNQTQETHVYVQTKELRYKAKPEASVESKRHKRVWWPVQKACHTIGWRVNKVPMKRNAWCLPAATAATAI